MVGLVEPGSLERPGDSQLSIEVMGECTWTLLATGVRRLKICPIHCSLELGGEIAAEKAKAKRATVFEHAAVGDERLGFMAVVRQDLVELRDRMSSWEAPWQALGPAAKAEARARAHPYVCQSVLHGRVAVRGGQPGPSSGGGMESLESGDVGLGSRRLTGGHAAMANIFLTLEASQDACITPFKRRICKEVRAYFMIDHWTTEGRCLAAFMVIEGHRILKKLMIILGHAYEVAWRHPTDQRSLQEIVVRAYQVGLQAMASNGSWKEAGRVAMSILLKETAGMANSRDGNTEELAAIPREPGGGDVPGGAGGGGVGGQEGTAGGGAVVVPAP